MLVICRSELRSNSLDCLDGGIVTLELFFLGPIIALVLVERMGLLGFLPE